MAFLFQIINNFTECLILNNKCETRKYSQMYLQNIIAQSNKAKAETVEYIENYFYFCKINALKGCHQRYQTWRGVNQGFLTPSEKNHCFKISWGVVCCASSSRLQACLKLVQNKHSCCSILFITWSLFWITINFCCSTKSRFVLVWVWANKDCHKSTQSSTKDNTGSRRRTIQRSLFICYTYQATNVYEDAEYQKVCVCDNKY